MEVVIGSDHRGYELKEIIIGLLENDGYKVIDVGCEGTESVNYPDYAHKLAEYVSPARKGILICGSGIGVCMAANRHTHVRAATCRDVMDAKMTRMHNDANVLCIGADSTTTQLMALEMVDVFLETEFEGGRHEKRVQMI